jgi:hypothetical protein
MQKTMPRQRLLYTFVISTLLFFIFSCGHVRLIAEYDEVIDQGITELQKKTEDHLSILEKKMTRMELLKDGSEEKENLRKEVSYAASEEFYRLFRVDLRVMQSRAESYDKNDLTIKMMTALEEILKEQEGIHQRGFETSDDVTDMRTAFTRAFKGILKLEIAKKRGKE